MHPVGAKGQHSVREDPEEREPTQQPIEISQEKVGIKRRAAVLEHDPAYSPLAEHPLRPEQHEVLGTLGIDFQQVDLVHTLGGAHAVERLRLNLLFEICRELEPGQVAVEQRCHRRSDPIAVERPGAGSIGESDPMQRRPAVEARREDIERVRRRLETVDPRIWPPLEHCRRIVAVMSSDVEHHGCRRELVQEAKLPVRHRITVAVAEPLQRPSVQAGRNRSAANFHETDYRGPRRPQRAFNVAHSPRRDSPNVTRTPRRAVYDPSMSAASWFRTWAENRVKRRRADPQPEDPERSTRRDLTGDDPHLARGREFYSQWLRPGTLVFDVGANVGDRSRMFLELGARVVAVEPQPDCAQALRRLGNDSLVVEEIALGTSPGFATIRVASESTISSMSDEWIGRVQRSGRFARYEWLETIPVEVTTLDSLIDRHGLPDFCKIDVEGYERDVVSGLSQPLPMLSFEFAVEYADGAEAVLTRLEELGFERFNFAPEETFSFVWDEWRDIHELRTQLASLPPAELAWGDVYAAG